MTQEKKIKNQNILISGASLAGPALAYWLHRYGFHPTVLEQAPALREGGYKVDIRGSAIDVAERMGIITDIRRASTNMRGASYVNGDNKQIATMSADAFSGRVERDDEIMRGDLAHILYERTHRDVEYIFDDSIASMTQSDAGVEVTFRRGKPRTFDLVVGADGLHSNVRALTFGDESQFTHHLDAYISIFTIPNFLHLDHWELYYNTPGKLMSIYSARHNTEARSFFIFTSPKIAYSHRDSRQQKQILTDAFAGNGWYTSQLLQLAQDAPDFYFDSMSLVQMDRWSSDRVVLLGDAAYCASPFSGQGTSLALVGAYVLAGELAEAMGDYRQAYARYESAMRGFTKVNQGLASEAAKGAAPRTWTQIWLQNQMLRVLPYLPWKGLIAGKMTQVVQQAANAITLKHYGE